ncbi:MAG: signal peptide peptidase SppA [Gammaproteobacteria bacterium]|nr:signal peptide peptidase SppA [Gammaproteobacteria bacterium]
MSDSNPGILRRLWRFLGSLVRIARTLISTLLLLVFIAMLASLFGHDLKPLPEHALLRVAPTGTLVEQRSWSDPRELLGPGGGPAPETRVADLVEAIGAAATDARITGIALELDDLAGGGLDKLETVGLALLAFRTSGKPVIAVGDSYTQAQYYLASFADEIHLNPFGNVLLTGLGSYHLYFKEALDKLRINFHVFRVGTYKDAVEPFIGTGMSDASREHTSAWLAELWHAVATGLEGRRHLAAGAIDDYVNHPDAKLAAANGDGAQLALQSGLIDHISTRPEILTRLRALAGKGGDERDYGYVDLREYLAHLNLRKPADAGQPKIGVLVASGVMYDGDQQAGAIGGDSLARLIRQTREKAAIKALVVRIDSPGGSAFAADLIRQELLATRAAGIPVVVSMGTVAASGGYWIAAEADEIWAEPTTITGSIGVFGMVPTFEDSLAAIGIHNDGVGTSPLAGAMRLDRPMTEQAARLIQGSVDNIYQRFVGLVAAGRHMDVAAVDGIAQGRVWTGRQAQERGLVDHLGNLEAAVAAAAHRAGVENYQTVPIEPPLDFRERFIRQLMESGDLPEAGVAVPPTSLGARVGELLRLLVRSSASDWITASRQGVFLHCLECGTL